MHFANPLQLQIQTESMSDIFFLKSNQIKTFSQFLQILKKKKPDKMQKFECFVSALEIMGTSLLVVVSLIVHTVKAALQN